MAHTSGTVSGTYEFFRYKRMDPKRHRVHFRVFEDKETEPHRSEVTSLRCS